MNTYSSIKNYNDKGDGFNGKYKEFDQKSLKIKNLSSNNGR
ncbi:hypothetical protein WKT22_00729 [Candidatus Lokiarchaeum ossiferum]